MDMVQQIAAIIGNHELSREDRMQLAKIQAQVGIDAIEAGDSTAARAFFVDALHHLDRVSAS